MVTFLSNFVPTTKSYKMLLVVCSTEFVRLATKIVTIVLQTATIIVRKLIV